ncbi:hypothetical protein [uncultured Paraglaciecola sp.]|uniref:hypothetical protein n=1 Tax=uncultured Paraglaciecola sp. TaxID=1765024 RepID=UPI00262D6BE3|nr:hypothetical protein [uncultured Paraglaciecola sp.]
MLRNPENIKYLIALAIAMFGAAVHATNQLRLARKKGDLFTAIDFLILFPIALLSGLLFGLASQLISDNPIHLMLSAGTGAFLGIAGLNKIADVVLTALVRGKSNGSS